MALLLRASRTLLLLLAGVGMAQAQVVRIGDQSKPARGTITAVEAGDVACYLSFDDATGQAQVEMAEFELCEAPEALLGRTFELRWRLGQVLADSCQGNPDCTESQQVALLHQLVPVAESGPAAAPGPDCSASETVVFRCRAGSRQLAVCAAAAIGPDRGHVQYRFGKPGLASELELPPDRLPQSRATGSHRVSGASEAYSGGGLAWLRFRRADYAYTVYSGIGRWGEDGETLPRAGVVVTRAGTRVAQVDCDAGASTGELGPDWLDAAGIGRADPDEEFTLP